MSTTTTDIGTIVDAYIAIWNEIDPGRRRELIASALAEDINYRDPMLSGDGHGEIETAIAAVQQQMPDHQLRRVGTIESHNDRVRFRWEVVAPDGGDPVIAGTDTGIVAPDGRLRSLSGFFDSVTT